MSKKISNKLNQIRIEMDHLNLEMNIQEIHDEFTQLDIKRIRAFLEPGEKEPGVTWLDYYNQKLQEKREELKKLI